MFVLTHVVQVGWFVWCEGRGVASDLAAGCGDGELLVPQDVGGGVLVALEHHVDDLVAGALVHGVALSEGVDVHVAAHQKTNGARVVVVEVDVVECPVDVLS